jgi:aspartate racemase
MPYSFEGERERVMQGIYDGVKVGNMALAHECFAGVARALAERHGLSTLVLGCTEIPLALSAVPGMDALDLVDPAALLARALAQRAYAVAGGCLGCSKFYKQNRPLAQY